MIGPHELGCIPLSRTGGDGKGSGLCISQVTQNNHYVPVWYQRGFLEPGHSSFLRPTPA